MPSRQEMDLQLLGPALVTNICLQQKLLLISTQLTVKSLKHTVTDRQTE